MTQASNPTVGNRFSMWLVDAPWRQDAEWKREPSGVAERYRREASRLVGLAASSPIEETKQDFLRLALHYEALAAHASRRS